MSTHTLEDDVALSDKKPSKSRTHAIKKNLHPFYQRHKKHLILAVSVISLIAVIYYAYNASTHEETDDAYVTGHLHDVSSRINAVVTDVLVNDNQFVHEGDVLVKLDPSEYQALAAAAQAQLNKAQADLDREQPLVAMHALSQQDLDATKSTHDVDLAQLKLADLQIDYSTIHAPASGIIGRKNVEVGNRVSSGQTLLVVVEPDLWVVANFKETQLAHMRKGQPAQITIDAIPGKVFEGKVDSFSPATGNEFALLPADNSTGNFTKIVQRVPVKIVFDPASTHGYEARIRAGESVVVKVALTSPPPQP
ncbi:MAG: HlyD family secretion protein [Methylacidiphilales bacterium]|nr:HlyD family secretion protein [Candidatus Methylacidiphilales bacterium]